MAGVVLFQYVQFLLCAAVWGGAAYTFVLPRETRDAESPLRAPVLASAALCLVPVLLGRTWHQAWTILGEYEGPILPAMRSYLRYAPQGIASVVMIPCAILLGAGLLALRGRAPARGPALLSMATMLPLLAAQSAQGHAQQLVAVARGTIVDGIHQIAALTWTGALLHLGIAAARGRLPERGALLRFSGLATSCVIVLAASGLVTYYLHFILVVPLPGFVDIRIPTAPLLTPWGRTLEVKLALVLAMLLLALRNRRTVRSTMGLPSARLVWVEIALGVVILLASSLLTQQNPHGP